MFDVDFCINNTCAESNLIELKLWAELHGLIKKITNDGGSGGIVFPATTGVCFNLPDLNLPSGMILGIRVIGPETGEELNENTVVVP